MKELFGIVKYVPGACRYILPWSVRPIRRPRFSLGQGEAAGAPLIKKRQPAGCPEQPCGLELGQASKRARGKKPKTRFSNGETRLRVILPNQMPSGNQQRTCWGDFDPIQRRDCPRQPNCRRDKPKRNRCLLALAAETLPDAQRHSWCEACFHR